MPAQTKLLPPRYSDVRFVARGGMGEIFRATDESLERTVAVKVLAERFAADEEIRKRFTREALAAARLAGEPGTITIYDVGEWEGRPFIVMQYLAGGSLEDVLKREGRQEPGRALEWLAQAGVALDRAHTRGVVHRDVKPANLLLDGDQNIHVTDFGIATATGLDSLTQTGTVLGTAGYLAPEQAEGRQATPASDRYALGVVGFELLTGSRPFRDESVTAEATAHVHAPVPAASGREPAVPPQVDAVFLRALAKDPAQRFPTSAEFVDALQAAYTGGDGNTTWIAATPRGSRRRSPLPALLALAALLALGGGIAASLVLSHGAGKQSASVSTVTRSATTVHKAARTAPTVAAARTAPTVATAAARTTPTVATAAASGSTLALRGFQRLQTGDTVGALPLLQLAAQQLDGTNSIAEAYNDYNLADALARTSGCTPHVLSLLDRSQQIQGHRKEIDQLRKRCRKAP